MKSKSDLGDSQTCDWYQKEGVCVGCGGRGGLIRHVLSNNSIDEKKLGVKV